MSDRFRDALRRHGIAVPPGTDPTPPATLIHFGDSPGDDLLCTTITRELKRRGHGEVWMMTRHPELFAGNPDIAARVPRDAGIVAAVKSVGGNFVLPIYSKHDWENDAGDPVPRRHILAIMCGMAGVSGPVDLRPYLHLRPAEVAAGRLVDRQVAVHTSGLSAAHPMRNKEWVPGRFQAVVDALKGRSNFVQLGSPGDPALDGVVDLRGKTTPRQAAAVLAGSRLFVGLVGFLMHLARSVDCRSVIVYGGRETPAQSGYICNENLYTPVNCSPCWRWNRCGHDHVCMTEISPETVIAAVDRAVGQAGRPLEVESAEAGVV